MEKSYAISANRQAKHRSKKAVYFGFQNKLGQGTYGTVFLAEMVLLNNNNQEVSRKKVAIKALTPYKFGIKCYNFNKQQDIIHYEKNRQFLAACAPQHQRKGFHLLPIIDHFYGTNNNPQNLFLTLPLCEFSFREVIVYIHATKQLRSPCEGLVFEVQQILKIMHAVAQGLRCIHQQQNGLRIAHRDLKPQNILFMKCSEYEKYDVCLKKQNQQSKKHQMLYFRVLISGLGMSKQLKYYQPNKNSVRGSTLRYTAPEIINSQNFDTHCDIWSFGIVLLRALGSNPFAQASKLNLNDKNNPSIQIIDAYNRDHLKIEKQIEKILKKWRNFRQGTQRHRQFIRKILQNCLIIQFKIQNQNQMLNSSEQGFRWNSTRLLKQFDDFFIKKQEMLKTIKQVSDSSQLFQMYKVHHKICKQCLDIYSYLHLTSSNVFHIKILMLLAFKEYINIYYTIFVDEKLINNQFELIKKDFRQMNSSDKQYRYESLIEQVTDILNCEQNAMLINCVPQLKPLYKLSANSLEIQRIMRKYLDFFRPEVQQCSIAKVSLTLFYLVAYKQFLFQNIGQRQNVDKLIQLYESDKESIISLDTKRRRLKLTDIKWYQENRNAKEEDRELFEKLQTNQCYQYIIAKSKFRYKGISEVQAQLKQVIGSRVHIDIVDII